MGAARPNGEQGESHHDILPPGRGLAATDGVAGGPAPNPTLISGRVDGFLDAAWLLDRCPCVCRGAERGIGCASSHLPGGCINCYSITSRTPFIKKSLIGILAVQLLLHLDTYFYGRKVKICKIVYSG